MSMKTDIMAMYVLGLDTAVFDKNAVGQNSRQRELETLSELSYSFAREALDDYRLERSFRLGNMGLSLDVASTVLLIDEVKARLGISDSHIVYDLINDEKLLDNIYPILKQKIDSTTNPHKVLITFDSLKKYLGDYSDKILYNSSKSIEKIDLDISKERLAKVAKNYGLGFKLKPFPKSARLYSSEDLQKIEFLEKKTLSDKLPAIYAHHMMGMINANLTKNFSLEDLKKTKLSLAVYQLKRNNNLRKFNLANIDNILTVTEVSKLLNTTPKCGRDYIRNNFDNYTTVKHHGKDYIFVNSKSFKGQLGKKYAGKLLYSSVQVNKLILKPITNIDIIAKYKKIGLKLKDNHQGNYRFSESDITIIKNTQVSYYDKQLTLTNVKTGKSETFDVFK